MSPRWPEGRTKAEPWPTTRQARRDRREAADNAKIDGLAALAPELPAPRVIRDPDGPVLIAPGRTFIPSTDPLATRIDRGEVTFYGLDDAGMPLYRDEVATGRRLSARLRARKLLAQRPLTPGEVERVAGLLAPYATGSKEAR